MNRFQRHNEFARTLGVSPPYVTRLRNEGKAVRDEGAGTYDVRHPVNALLIETAASTKAPEIPDDDADPTLRELQTEKLRAELGRTQEQRLKLALQNAEARRILLPREMTQAYAGELGSGIRQFIHEVPRGVLPGIIADVRSGNEDNALDRLEQALETALERALSMGEQAVNSIAEAWSDDETVEPMEV